MLFSLFSQLTSFSYVLLPLDLLPEATTPFPEAVILPWCFSPFGAANSYEWAVHKKRTDAHFWRLGSPRPRP